ncbi:hypothetical protein GCM10009750_11550 [Agromyces salentinus]|uniref:Uncharacterized protein n=2 Tax=Agromyces salentinus TaxID=269421 RepID=A0ABN2MJV2_9MICO
MISELSYLHLQQAEEDRFAQELERRRDHRERIREADAAAVRTTSSGQPSGDGWWAEVLHPWHTTRGARAERRAGHAHGARTV